MQHFGSWLCDLLKMLQVYVKIKIKMNQTVNNRKSQKRGKSNWQITIMPQSTKILKIKKEKERNRTQLRALVNEKSKGVVFANSRTTKVHLFIVQSLILKSKLLFNHLY